MKFANTFSNISIAAILAVSMCCSGAKTYAEEQKWDFEYGFKHLNEVGADKYVVENKNLRKYTEWQNPPITYLGPKSNDVDCSLTRKFTFDRPTSTARLKVNLATYNFGGGRVGKASCWASVDGKDWKLVLDNPTPSRIDSYKGFDDDLPKELTGSKELWVQMRLHVSRAPNSSYTLAQFGRSTANAKSNVFEIKAKLETVEEKKPTDFTLSDATVEENKPEGTVVGSFSASSVDKGKYDFRKGLVAWYPFDGNASDMSGNGLHGNVSGATPGSDRHGATGKAYSFDGTNDNIVVSEIPQFESQLHTLSCWVKANAWSGDIISKDGEYSQRQWLLGSASMNGRIRAHVWTETDTIFDSNSVLNRVQWHHIAQVWDGSLLHLYINGLKDQDEEASGSLSSGDQPVRIGGGAPTGNSYWFNGSIDDVRIYNRALSATEVAALYEMENNQLTFTLVDGNGSQDNKLFAIDANGALKTAVSFDFETKSSHRIRVRATDENNGTVEKIFVISVTDVAENAAPVFTSSPTAFTRENETFAIDANATDPDGDALTFSLTGGDDREKFTINAATGALSFRSAPDFENPADTDGNNVYLVELSVSDGKLTASQLLAATVTDVNEGPTDPPPPPDKTPPPPPVDDRPKDPLPPKPTPEPEPKPEPKPEPEPEPKPIDLKAGLLAHYPYTGNAKDHSGNGHHLEVNGSTPTEDRFGMPNSAYTFDGKDDFMFADLEERKGDFTLSLWAKAENVEQSRYRSVINIHDKTPGSKHTCQIHTSGGRYPTYQFFSSNPESFALVKAEWQHLAVTVSGKVIRFYENGRRVYSQELEGGEANKFSNIIIGRNREANAMYHGTIDDVYLYERAISDAEVERLYDGGFEDSDGDGLTDDYEKGYGRYQIVDGKFTWKEAKADAEKRGGHLATFVTNEEWESFLAIVGGKDNVPYGAWMGGTDEKTEGVWEWITNEVWKYANWRRGEPNNAGGNEDHLHVWHIKSNTQKQWNDQRTGKFPYILEYGYYTDPTLADSDNDGVNDGVETAAKTDPNNPLSRPAPDKKAPKEQPGPPPPDRDFSKKVEELTKANEEKDKKIEELEKRIEAYAKSMAELNATNAALAKKVEDRDKTIASLRSEHKDLRQQLVNAREDVANASQKLSTTEKELETAKKVANTPFVNGWIYDPEQGWLFTNADLYPSIYSSTTKSWHHYEPGSAKPRLFYSYKDEAWEAWDPIPDQDKGALAKGNDN